MRQLTLDQKITLKGEFQRRTKTPWPRMDTSYLIRYKHKVLGYRTKISDLIG
jgi:hypothetical protein